MRLFRRRSVAVLAHALAKCDLKGVLGGNRALDRILAQEQASRTEPVAPRRKAQEVQKCG